MHQTSTSIASLSCQVIQQDAVPPELVVVLCHGFGAPGDDLVPLGAEMLERRPALGARVRFVFPAAPLSLANLGMGPGRAWWMLEMERLMALQMGTAEPEAVVRTMREEIPEGLPAARKLLMGLVAELSRQTKLPLGRIVLGGFSQGSMLATDAALRLEEAPAALCVLSGALVSEAEWAKRAPARAGLKVFQSHGRQDPIIPYEGGIALRDFLTQAGLPVDFLAFNGGHTITLEGLERVGALLEGLLPAR